MADFIKIPDKTLYVASETSKVKAVVGGIQPDYFAPSVNVSFEFETGEEQAFFNICDDPEQVRTHNSSETHSGNRVSVRDGNVESAFELFDTNLKVERVYHQTPETAPRYKLTYSDGISFHYQGELTPIEIEEGCFRPDNVVGSYAVYCDKQGGRYGSGKVGHLYAPYWSDATGRIIKGRQILENDFLVFELPSEEWLAEATLPITLDPDLGYTTIGSSSTNLLVGAGLFSVAIGQLTENGTLDSVTFYDSDTSSVAGFYVGVYDDAGSTPGNLVFGSTAQTAGGGAQFHTTNAGGETLTSGESYWVAVQTQASNDITLRYDSVTFDGDKFKSNTYGTFPDPYGTPGGGNIDRRYTAYITYTASGAGPIEEVVEGSFNAMGDVSRRVFYNRSVSGEI